MRTDRYVKVILTIIAIELAWLGLRDLAPRASAQAEPARVILAGVELPQPLQVAVVGQVTLDRRAPIKIEADRPLKIEADRPLRVESVRYTPGDRPGD